MVNQYGIDADAMRSALDTDERSRIETDENYTMVLVNIPNIETHNDKELYDTIPLSIFVVKKAVITVSLEKTPMARCGILILPCVPALCFRFCTGHPLFSYST